MNPRGRARSVFGLLGAFGGLLPVALGACGDRSGSAARMLGTAGGRGERVEALEARLTAEPAEVDSGGTVLLRARIRRAADTRLVPTAFRASVQFDTAVLRPLEVVDPSRTTGPALRAVNLAAQPGRVRAAGAAPDGFATTVLFAVRARVRDSTWRRSMALELEELYVTRDSLGEVSDRVPVAAEVAAEASVGARPRGSGRGRSGSLGRSGTGRSGSFGRGGRDRNPGRSRTGGRRP